MVYLEVDILPVREQSAWLLFTANFFKWDGSFFSVFVNSSGDMGGSSEFGFQKF